MKTRPVLAVFLGLSLSANAQGLFTFSNDRNPTFLPQPTDPFEVRQGNTSSGNPPGTQIYDGGPVIGTGFTAQLWGGPLGTPEAGLTLLATTTFRTSTSLPLAGTVVPVTASFPGLAAGSQATFQMRAWDNLSGSVTSWGQVLNPANNDIVLRGNSTLFSPALPLGDGSSVPILNVAGSIPSFNLHLQAIPEPSVMGLGLVAAGVLLAISWRASKR